MAEVLAKKKPKGRGRGRARRKATDSPRLPGLLDVEQDSQSCSSYDELSQSDVDAYRSGSQRSSFSDSAPNLLEKLASSGVPKSDEQFLDAEMDKISFSSMEMTSSPLVMGRKPQVDSPLAAKAESASVQNGPALSLNMPTGITPLAGNMGPLPGDLDGSFHDDAKVAEPDLDEKKMIFIRVTQCVDPSNFSGQIGRDEDFEAFSELETAIGRYCHGDDVVKHNDDFGPQYYVLARQRKTKTWKRAFVMGVDREADEVDVYYIDYGMSEILQLADVIYPVPDDFLQFQKFNYVCALDSVKPLASVWISRAVTLFKELVFEKKLEVEVVPTQPLNVTIYIGDERKSVADLLLEEEVAMPCVSPSLMLQSPEPIEGVSIASTLVTPEQYSSMASPETGSKMLLPDATSQTVCAESTSEMMPEEFGAALETDGDVMLREPEFGTDGLSQNVAMKKVGLENDSSSVAYPYVGASPSGTFRDSSSDDDTPERKTSSRSKPSTKRVSSAVKSVSESKTGIKSKTSPCVDARKAKSDGSTGVAKQIPDHYDMKTPEKSPDRFVRAKSEPRHVKPPNKAPPAFQFDQLFKASAKITKPRIPSSPDTPEADDLWKADPDILFMFGKEALEERRMNSLGLIEEQTDDEVQQNINIVEKIRQGREGGLRKSQQAASQRTRSPKGQSPVSSRSMKGASGHPERDSSPRVNSPQRSRTVMKKNLDKVIKASEGKPEGKALLVDGDAKVADKKTGTKKGSDEETRDQAIVEFLCCLQQAVETSDRKVRELAFENTMKFMDDLNLDLSCVLSATDLEQYIRSLLRRGVLDTNGEFIMDLLNLLQNHDSFGSTFSFAMSDVMLEFVKVATRGRTKHERSVDFCQFLIKIIKASTKWMTRARTSVLDFTQKTLEKWLIYNKKGSDLDKKLLTHSTADLERLFLQCTLTILTAVGHVINDAYPEKVVWMMAELRERQLDHDKWNRKTRSNVLDLLLLQARGWDRGDKQNGRHGGASDGSGCCVGVQCNLLGTAEKDSEIAARLKEEPAEYTLVKAMLYDLHLDHLYTNFVSWGITDSLIKSEEMHLGNYLVGCGFTIPLVSRMMEYLDRDMPAPPVEEEQNEPHRSLGELVKDLGLPSGRMMERRSDCDRTPEQTPEKMETSQRRSEVTPTKTLDFGSKEASPSSLKEVAETLFKTDKEIRKKRASGSRDVVFDEYNISEYFRVPYAKAGSGAGVVLDDKEEFPPLADTDEAETFVELDDDTPLKQFSFSDILRKKAERDVIAKFSEPDKFGSVPEGPTIQDWFQERLKDGSVMTELGEGAISNSAAGEPCRKEKTYAESAKHSEPKLHNSEKVSEKISDDWFFVESEDEEEDENPLPNFPKQTLLESQPRAQAEVSTRSRASDSWKMKRYSQTSPISKDPCNNVIAREDSLGLNAISDLLESEACGDASEVVTVVTAHTESPKSENASGSKKPSWWRVPSPPKEICATVADKCVSETDVKSSGQNTKIPQVKNKANTDSVKKTIETGSKGSSKVQSKKALSDLKMDGPESVVDWMCTGSSALKGRMGPMKERLTPARESPGIKAADVDTRSSTPDCWSDLSDSEVDDPPVMFEPKFDQEACEKNRPKIDKSASGDWIKGEGNDDFGGSGARLKTSGMDGRRDVVESGLRTRTNGTDAVNRGHDERKGDSESLQEKLENSRLKNQTGSERSSSLDSKSSKKESGKKSHDSFEYDFQYVPRLEEPDESRTAENPINVDSDSEQKMDISDRKFAFRDGDNLSDSDSEVMVIMEEVIHDRIMEEKERKRKLHEKYVCLPEPDHTFKGFSQRPRCCTCGDENHRTYDCPNFK